MVEFVDDPMGFVMYAYPWDTEPSIQMVKLVEPWASRYGLEYGPDKWACEELDKFGEKIKANAFNGHEPVPAIREAIASGHGIGKGQPLTEAAFRVIVNPAMEAINMEKIIIGDLRVGDYVFGSNGEPTKIIGTNHYKREHYKVTFDDGSSTIVSGEHEWAVRGRKERRNGLDGWRVIETQDILRLGVLRPNGKVKTKQWEIPIQGAAQYAHFNVYNPYIFGVWLGDGCSVSGRIGSTREELWDKMGISPNKDTLAYKRRKLLSATPKGLRARLNDYGMMPTTSDQKFIPRDYKYNSEDVRRNLIAGMLDTDGEVNKSGSIGYSSTSKQLVLDLIWIVRSLGGKAMLQPSVKKGKYTKGGIEHACKDCYRCTINFGGKWNPFTHTYKREILKENIEHRYLCRWIESIEPVGLLDGMCITVEAEDHLYLTNDFIVTHNSAYTAWITNFIMSTRPFAQGTVTANTSSQLETKTWAQIAKWSKLCITSHWFEINTGRGSMKMYHKEFPEKWFCSAQTCREENSEAFAGQHAAGSTSFYLFDEASAVVNKIWEVAEGGLMIGEPMFFVFGNPTKNSGRFYDCFHKFKHRWGHRQIDGRDVAITNKEHQQEMIDDYGIDSDIVKVRVRGMFPSMSAKQFISVEDADAGFGKSLRPEQYMFAPKILTVDPAWEGDDLFEIGLRQGLAFKILRSIPKNDNDMQMASLIASLEDEHQADAVFIDAGYGTGIISAAKVLKRNDWRLVWFASTKTPDPGCLNMRAYMWKQARDWLKDGGCYPASQEMHDDLIGPETIFRADGKLQLESKKDMKARGIPSPGKGDILGLSFAYPVNKKHITRGQAKNLDVAEAWEPNDYL